MAAEPLSCAHTSLRCLVEAMAACQSRKSDAFFTGAERDGERDKERDGERERDG